MILRTPARLSTPVRSACVLGATFLLTLPSAWGQTTLYGRLNVAVEQVGVSGAPASRSVTRESNNRSVIGFRGSEDLGGGVQALFQIEGALSLDTGAGTSLANRDTRVGLATPWGTAFMGHWGLPYLTATSGFDPYYPTTAGYMSLMGNGSASSTDNVINRASFDRRQQNSLHYISPTWRGFSGRVALALNEGEVGPAGSRPRLWSGSLNYDEGPWNLSLAHEAHSGYQGPGLNDTGTKVGAAYRWGDWRLAVAAEQLRYELPAGTLARQSAYASATWQVGQGSFRLGYAHAGTGRGPAGAKVGFISAGDATGARQWTFGYDHALSKRTALYAYASRIDNQARADYDLALNSLGVGAGESPHVLAAGVRHSF